MNTMLRKTQIINVTRKPRQCPVCGEEIVDIIYGTDDMTTYEYFQQYRRIGVMGGDQIPKNPPIWACAGGCKRFRKINLDGTIADVKPKMLKNIRRRPISVIQFGTSSEDNIETYPHKKNHYFVINIETEFGEKEELHITALTQDIAIETARDLIARGNWGIKGVECVSINVKEE